MWGQYNRTGAKIHHECIWLFWWNDFDACCCDQRLAACQVLSYVFVAYASAWQCHREVLTVADFDYIVAESRHPHALHQSALYMALIRGNLEMAEVILNSIIMRLDEMRFLHFFFFLSAKVAVVNSRFCSERGRARKNQSLRKILHSLTLLYL